MTSESRANHAGKAHLHHTHLPHLPPPPHARKAWGDFAEDIATRWLERQGYEILTRNYRQREGEIDIVCQTPQRLIFTEVRSLHHTDPAKAIATINWRKQQRLTQTAHIYLQKELPEANQQEIVFLNIGISFQRDGSIRLLQQPRQYF